MTKIFISYSRKDVEFVRRLATTLDSLGVDLWLDIEDIPAGMKWSTAIQQGLTTCTLMILVISPDSMASTNVEDEWQHYHSRKKPIIPILLRPISTDQMPFQLERFQWVDFHNIDYDNALKKLHIELERHKITLRQNHHAAPTPVEIPQIKIPPIIKPKFTLPMLEWIDIPAGKVTLEKIEGTFDVAPFAMAKYPVTNAQFDAFLAASDGYKNDEWWAFSDAAKAWRKKNLQPAESAFKGDKLPREMVCWFEAIAFCRWLANKTGLEVTLPTEMQWQWAAQGKDGLVYPYGQQFDPKKCNTQESGIGKTTPVNQYPDGKSPFGVFDMCGNVWEWCINEYQDPNTINVNSNNTRPLQGGSWGSNLDFARAADRRYSGPDHRNDLIGFRVVVGGRRPPSLT